MTATIEPVSAARALRWWTDKTLAPLRASLATACAEWSARWGVPAECLRLANACEATEPSVKSWQALPAPAVWMGCTDNRLADLLHRELFRSAARPDTLADDVTTGAVDDLASALAASFAAGTSEPAHSPSATDLKPWSGAVRIQLALGENASACWLHASAEALSTYLSKPNTTRNSTSLTKLAPVLRAIAHDSLSFRVELTPAELRLGDLQSLRIGDVLTLPHRLETPLSVLPGNDTSTTPIGLAYLGARNGHRAIELLRTDTELA